MTDPRQEVVIPDRATFKSAEVCELLKIQPYVLRSWENEFKDLGAAGTSGRVYRRGDVERAVRIHGLVFGDGLTLAGVRRRLDAERPPASPDPEPEPVVTDGAATAALSSDARARIVRARDDLRGLLAQLEGKPTPVPASAADFALEPPRPVQQAGPPVAERPQPARARKKKAAEGAGA